MDVRVQCYAGYRGDEEPRRFWLGARAIEVIEVVDRWVAPDHRYFKLRGDDGGQYILRHDEPSGRWELTLFRDPDAPEELPAGGARRGGPPTT